MVACALLAGCAGSPATPASNNVFTVIGREFEFSQPAIETQVGQPMMVVFKNDGEVTHDWVVEGLETAPVEGRPSDGHAEHGSHSHGMFELVAHDDHAEERQPMVEQGAHGVAAPGEETTIVFTPIRAGVFTIICTVPGHEAAGMYGTLTVNK